MPHSFKLSRRIARLRALLTAALVLALAACGADSFNPDSSTIPDPADQGTTLDGSTIDAVGVPAEDAPVAGDQPLASSSFSGGIPFGTWAQPTSTFGSTYNGAVRTIYPQFLLEELRAIKARGGRVAIKLSFGDRYIKDGDGDFSLSKWKDRVAEYKRLNFSTYINDGTIIGHYLIDEPQDKANWNGRPIPQSTIEEMAKFSKEIWPNMPTIVRTWPDYLDDWGGNYRYLDAAWAQYAANRWPNVDAFLDEIVTKARNKGLALAVGLNILNGSPSKGKMSSSQVRAYGSALLNSSYPCAFISWKYSNDYLSSSSIRDAMNYLRNKAENRSSKSCRA